MILKRKIKINLIKTEKIPVSVNPTLGTVEITKNNHKNRTKYRTNHNHKGKETDILTIEIMAITIETVTSIGETIIEATITTKETIIIMEKVIIMAKMRGRTTINMRETINMTIISRTETTGMKMKVKETTIKQEITPLGIQKDKVGKTVITNTGPINNPTTINSTTMRKDRITTITITTDSITMRGKTTSKEETQVCLISIRKEKNQNPYRIWKKSK